MSLAGRVNLINRVLRDLRRREMAWSYLSDWVCIFTQFVNNITSQGGHHLENLEKSWNFTLVREKSGKLWFACGVLPQLRWSQHKHKPSTVKVQRWTASANATVFTQEYTYRPVHASGGLININASVGNAWKC